MTMTAVSNGVAGMHNAASRLETSAGRIARVGTGLGDIDLATEFVNVLQAKHDFAASAKVTRIAGDMQRSAIDILA